LQWFFERYLPARNSEDWRASPMRAESLQGLPPVLMVTAEFDPLVDDCLAFAARLRDEGVDTEYLQVDGVVHGFLTLGKQFPQAAQAIYAAARALARALNSGD
jgi:acetyl esterase